ncbi:MAG: multiheme c-type cytochrome [Sulfurimonas sp.]|nr:multiheme c-type cytochrome [Sulfurimonas sp.]
MRRVFVKIALFAMSLSGIFMYAPFGLSWENFRVVQPLHIVGSILIMLFFMNSFIYRHIRRYFFIKKINSPDGWFLLLAFILVTLSGLYLFLVGNRGGDIFGIISFNIHLFGSFVLAALFLWHIIKAKRQNAQPLALFVAILFSYPSVSYSKITELSLLEIEKKTGVYHSEDWTSSAKCKSCHSEIFKQWSNSNHKHMAGSNPYYMVMETLAGEVEGQEFRKWCMSCHNPSALSLGHPKTTHAMDGNLVGNEHFESGAKTLLNDFKEHGNFRVEEGVSCITCHQIKEAKSKGNASFTLSLDREKYLLEDSKYDLGRWFSEKLINANPKVHKESYSKELYKESRYCASCHDEFHPQNGIKIVSTFQEWEKSPFNNPKDKTKHKSCIDCHMTYMKDGKFAPLRGTSTDGGVIKDDVKVHYFAGSNHFLAGLRDKVHEEQTLQLLRTSAKLDVAIKDGVLEVGVKNVGAGHHLPTGVADFREMWLEVEVKDKDKKLIFSSGKLKSDGNIEEGSRLFQKVFGDENSKPVGLLFWKYKTLLSDTRIPAGERRVEKFELPKGTKKFLHVNVKLNFRIYPQWVTDAVKKVFPVLLDPNVVELASVQKEFK